MNVKQDFLNAMETFKKTYSPKMFRDANVYQDWLAQTYYFVRHSTALLGYSLPHLKNDDLRHHFEKHLGEETRHDVVAIKDLQKMGRAISDFEESYATQAFYQSQYYRIQFQGGTTLLGYILFLEGIAVYWGKECHAEIKDLHKGSHFLKVHVEEDPEHVEGALKTIMGLSSEEQESIMKNFHYSMEMYSAILESCVRHNSKQKAA